MNRILFSSASDEWATPEATSEVIPQLRRDF